MTIPQFIFTYQSKLFLCKTGTNLVLKDKVTKPAIFM